ncbi:hypothetical protein ACU4GD_43370 [Cupriavidus basilensis]
MVGFAPEFGMSIYGATKAFVLFLSPGIEPRACHPAASTCRRCSRERPARKYGSAPASTSIRFPR